jgi:hypothetical protein
MCSFPCPEQGYPSEEIVQNSSVIRVLVVVLIAPSVYAKTEKANFNKKNQYVQGTVLRVQEHEENSASNYVGSSPTDAPLRSEVYAYDISIRVNCATYVGRWESPFDYLPSVFTPNRVVQVRVEKHLMYVYVPGEREFRMGLVDPPRSGFSGCDSNH